MPVRDFRDLIVWKKSIDLAETVYGLTKHWPRDERFGLITQIRSAAVSVSSNIAEGNGRGSTKDYIRFLAMAKGSLNEVRSLLHVSIRLEFAAAENLSSANELVEEVSRMLSALTHSLSKRTQMAQGATSRSR